MATPYKMTEEEKGKGGGTFRLVSGEHIGKGPVGCECVGCRPDATGRVGMNHRYRARRTLERYGEPPNGHPDENKWPMNESGFTTCLHRKGRSNVQGVRYGKEIVYADPPDYDNDIIVTDDDLERHNRLPDSIKFMRLDQYGRPLGDYLPEHLTPYAAIIAPPPEPYPLEKMNVAQLLSVAQDEEIDVKGASKKDELIRIIRSATASKVQAQARSNEPALTGAGAGK